MNQSIKSLDLKLSKFGFKSSSIDKIKIDDFSALFSSSTISMSSSMSPTGPRDLRSMDLISSRPLLAGDYKTEINNDKLFLTNNCNDVYDNESVSVDFTLDSFNNGDSYERISEINKETSTMKLNNDNVINLNYNENQSITQNKNINDQTSLTKRRIRHLSAPNPVRCFKGSEDSQNHNKNSKKHKSYRFNQPNKSQKVGGTNVEQYRYTPDHYVNVPPNSYTPNPPSNIPQNSYTPNSHSNDPLGNCAQKHLTIFPQNNYISDFNTNVPPNNYNPNHSINPPYNSFIPNIQKNSPNNGYAPNIQTSNPQNSCSPPQNSCSPPQNSCSPPQNSCSPLQNSCSPPQNNYSPAQNSCSPPQNPYLSQNACNPEPNVNFDCSHIQNQRTNTNIPGQSCSPNCSSNVPSCDHCNECQPNNICPENHKRAASTSGLNYCKDSNYCPNQICSSPNHCMYNMQNEGDQNLCKSNNQGKFNDHSNLQNLGKDGESESKLGALSRNKDSELKKKTTSENINLNNIHRPCFQGDQPPCSPCTPKDNCCRQRICVPTNNSHNQCGNNRCVPQFSYQPIRPRDSKCDVNSSFTLCLVGFLLVVTGCGVFGGCWVYLAFVSNDICLGNKNLRLLWYIFYAINLFMVIITLVIIISIANSTYRYGFCSMTHNPTCAQNCSCFIIVFISIELLLWMFLFSHIFYVILDHFVQGVYGKGFCIFSLMVFDYSKVNIDEKLFTQGVFNVIIISLFSALVVIIGLIFIIVGSSMNYQRMRTMVANTACDRKCKSCQKCSGYNQYNA